ncbi:hypothetical protein GCM10009676_13210 [Prauserella halophila]|uniref:ADP-ribosylglycohydrolase n=1 Tax=Prauserella halophila TaxID=185641 RepID=A0ABN1W338_9PSEU|nr:hypothetical protein [Prauserella halophila]MCP2236462.1 hypothetical protein [Prauserella halophila]
MPGSGIRRTGTTVDVGIGVLETWLECSQVDADAEIGLWLCRTTAGVGSDSYPRQDSEAVFARCLLADVQAAGGIPAIPEQLLYGDPRHTADRVTRCGVGGERRGSGASDSRPRTVRVLEALAVNAVRTRDISALAALIRAALVWGADGRHTVRRGVETLVAAVAPDGGVLRDDEGGSGSGLPTAVQVAWALVEYRRPGFTRNMWRVA